MNKFTPIELPESFNERFSAEDQADVREIITWLNQNQQSRAWIAKLSTVKSAIITGLFKGSYTGNPTSFIKQIKQAIANFERATELGDTPFVPTKFFSLTKLVCEETRAAKGIGCLTAYVGVGKTRCLREYTSLNSSTVLIESPPKMKPIVALNAIMRQTNTPLIKTGKGVVSNDERFDSIVAALKGTSYLIIVDEADKMLPSCLDYLRRIRDLAGIGIVLSGTEKLNTLIQVEHGQFDQIRSRVCAWPKTSQQASDGDMQLILEKTIVDAEGYDEKVREALMAYAKGSMRMLIENLIPTLRRHIIDKGKPLDVESMGAVFEALLNLKKVTL